MKTKALITLMGILSGCIFGLAFILSLPSKQPITSEAEDTCELWVDYGMGG